MTYTTNVIGQKHANSMSK